LWRFVVPSITSTPPNYVIEEWIALREALDADPAQGGIPSKSPDSLLVATWNIRHFGGVTDKWRAVSGDSPVRDVRSVLFIAEILSRFDIVAIQELKGKTAALRLAMEWLNRDEPGRWGVLVTDVTRGSKNNYERLGFLFDTAKVTASGLAAEIVIPPEGLSGVTDNAFQTQFARTPYAVSFRVGGHGFILTTLHVLYGGLPAHREPELRAIALWLHDWARTEHIWAADIIALGDFNTDRKGDARYDAFTSTGLHVPDELDNVDRTVFGNDPTDHFYDQIAWFTGTDGGPSLFLPFTGRAGGFDFVPLVLKDMSTKKKSYRISDHYPLWVEFGVPFR
jgi:endonuclease/exonuclease/phosphatase family metal-dependent hydrolase